jgi:ribose 5-phosphate isomerase B
MTEKPEVIAIGSDHAGFCVKEFLKRKLSEWGFGVADFGTNSEASVDYPDMIHPLAKGVDEGVYSRGIVLCGSGNGVAMVANKYPHVRAAVCWKNEVVVLARQHNNANILAIPARFITEKEAEEFVRLFLDTAFEGGRHEKRVDKIPRVV